MQDDQRQDIDFLGMHSPVSNLHSPATQIPTRHWPDLDIDPNCEIAIHYYTGPGISSLAASVDLHISRTINSGPQATYTTFIPRSRWYDMIR